MLPRRHFPLEALRDDSPACPICAAGRLHFAWHVGGRDTFECRDCGSRFAHVHRHTAGGFVCGLAAQDDAPNPGDEHRFCQAYESPFWACFPEPALELASSTRNERG